MNTVLTLLLGVGILLCMAAVWGALELMDRYVRQFVEDRDGS